MNFKVSLLFALVVVAMLTQVESRPEACGLEPEKGPCRARIPRYYYNPSTGKCEIFFYGGCRGNANNFRDLTNCQTVCDAF